MKSHFFKSLLCLMVLVGSMAACKKQETVSPDTTPVASETATYRITFTANWTASTHPADFPSNPHFSGLIGMSHNAQTVLYKSGENATTGIKNMAETGSKTPLSSEIEAMVQNKSALELISGGGVSSGTASSSVEFKVSKTHSLVSMVSMIAPSPDWFVGISGVNLLENDQWVTSKEVAAGSYDAGTDSGSTFASANLATSPVAPVSVITTAPLAVGGSVTPLGTFKIEKINP